MGTPLHHPAQLTLRLLPGGVLPGEHHVDEDTQGVNIGPQVGLGKTVLLRRGKARGPQDLGVGIMGLLVEPGGVKVDEDGVLPPEDHIFRLDVPVDSGQRMEDPQPPADLLYDPPGLLGGKQAFPQKKAQGIPLDKLLQHQIVHLPHRHLIHRGQVGAGDLQQLLIDLRVPCEPPEDELPPGGLMADGAHAAPGTLLEQGNFLVFRLNRL